MDKASVRRTLELETRDATCEIRIVGQRESTRQIAGCWGCERGKVRDRMSGVGWGHELRWY